MSDLLGKTISHYRILEKIGEGGMGVVYKAEDVKLKRIVALKFLTTQSLFNEEQKIRFFREARAAAALDHPNICTIHEIDEEKEHTFIVMAYIDGQSLSKKIEAGLLKLGDTLNIAVQVAEGLQAAHEKEIIHRDIKSANVMVTEKGQVTIMDFGIAKLKGVSKLTREAATLGTVYYMSPEQAQGKEVDHRSDIWSFGVVLYEMLTGQLPFKGEYEPAVVYSILNEEPEPLIPAMSGRKEIPLDFGRIVNKCLAKEPSDRYQRADELVIDLRQLKKESKPVVIPSRKGFRSETLLKRSAVGIFLFAVLLGIIYLVIPKGPKVPSVGILYMENLGGEENEFWARGITEDVISTVASAGLIRVSPMPDVMNVVGSNMSLLDIARKLRVKYLLTSSIHKRDDAFDLRCQLIEAETGRSLYNKRWIEPVEKASAISRTLAKDILSNLGISPKPHVTKTVTVNPDAYELYLRGKFRWEKRQNQQDREVARGLLDKAIELDQSLIVAKVMLGQSFRETGDYDRAMEIFRECLAESERIDDQDSQALTVKNMADIYLLRGNYNTALEYYKESLRIARNIGDKSQEESILLNMGSVYYSKGDSEQALKYYEESLDAAIELGNQRGEGDARSNLGAIYLEVGDYDRAMDSYRHSLSIFRELGEKGPETYSKIGMGLILTIKGNFDEALGYFEKSLELAKVVGDKRSEMYSHFYLGNVYYQMEQNDAAYEYYQHSLQMAQAIGDLYSEGISHLGLGVVMVQKNNYVLAAHYFDLACNTWRKLNDLSYYALSLSWWGFSDMRYEDLESAQVRANETESIIRELELFGEYVVVVNWNLSQIYSGLSEPLKANTYLQEAYMEVMKRADHFKDPKDRRTFLDNVRENRDVISAYQQLGTGSG